MDISGGAPYILFHEYGIRHFPPSSPAGKKLRSEFNRLTRLIGRDDHINLNQENFILPWNLSGVKPVSLDAASARRNASGMLSPSEQ